MAKIYELLQFFDDGYVACDSDGYWFWYSNKPRAGRFGFTRTSYVQYPLCMLKIEPYEGDWKESVIKIGNPIEKTETQKNQQVIETEKILGVLLDKLKVASDVFCKGQIE